MVPVDPRPVERARRRYYSVRHGRRAAAGGFELGDFKRFFAAAFDALEEKGLFQEWFGYHCVDAGEVFGAAGSDVDLFLFRKTRRMGLWPIRSKIADYSEDDVFDVIEVLFDHCSKGVEGFQHSFGGCGWHYSEFDRAAGRAIYREKVNEILADYGSGFELSEEGEILILAEEGLDTLLAAPLPSLDPKNVEARVAAAALKYRRRGSSGADRRDAVRDLADVLEFLREDVKAVLKTDDEKDLFNLANNFGIRHHRRGQKTDYDQSIWLSWMFHHYLATIHACLRLIEKSKRAPTIPSTRNSAKRAQGGY